MSHNILNTAFTVQHIHSIVPFSQIAISLYIYIDTGIYRYIIIIIIIMKNPAIERFAVAKEPPDLGLHAMLS